MERYDQKPEVFRGTVRSASVHAHNKCMMAFGEETEMKMHNGAAGRMCSGGDEQAPTTKN